MYLELPSCNLPQYAQACCQYLAAISVIQLRLIWLPSTGSHIRFTPEGLVLHSYAYICMAVLTLDLTYAWLLCPAHDTGLVLAFLVMEAKLVQRVRTEKI
jgi:hypothetical protein